MTKFPGNIDGQPFDIADLDGCEIMLLDHTDQVQIDNVTNSRIFIGSSAESIFVRNCTGCIFTIACKQLRTRDCVQCDFYLYSQTDPIIETSSAMRFAPFNGAYNGLRQHFVEAELDPTDNHWSRVYDFNDPEKSGANWCIIAQEQEMQPWTLQLNDVIPGIEDQLGPPENPVPRDAQATIHDEGGDNSMQAFSFDTSQQQAENVMKTDPFEAPVAAIPDPFGAPATSPMVSESLPPAAPVENLADQPESWPQLEAFEMEQKQKIKEKQQKEDKMVKDVKKMAEESLDKHYGQRTDRLAQRAAMNREQEEEKIKTQTLLKEKAEDQPWTRVLELVDINQNVSKSKKKATGEETQNEKEPSDLSRMKSILVHLKNSNGLEINKP